MIKKKKICVSCKNESYIWSKKRCKTCFNKEFPPKTIKKINEKGKIKKEEKKEWLNELHQWELNLWDKQEVFSSSLEGHKGIYCKECYKFLNTAVYKHNLCCYSHLISKSSRPDLAMVEQNLAIVCPDCHSKFENNPNNTPIQKELRDKLKEIYG